MKMTAVPVIDSTSLSLGCSSENMLMLQISLQMLLEKVMNNFYCTFQYNHNALEFVINRSVLREERPVARLRDRKCP